MTPQQWQAHMLGLRNDMRDALVEYRKFDAKWNRLNDAFLSKIQEENRIRRNTGRPAHTPLSIAQQKESWLEMKDTFSAAQWWRDKAQALATAITAEEAAFRMTRER